MEMSIQGSNQKNSGNLRKESNKKYSAVWFYIYPKQKESMKFQEQFGANIKQNPVSVPVITQRSIH